MSELRNYFTRHPEVIPTGQREYDNKIRNNQAAGRKAFETGEYRLFHGWSEKDSGTFDVIFELDEISQQRVKERVIEPLHSLAQAHKIQAIHPGYGDLPPHVVLQPAVFTDMTIEQKSEAQSWLLSNRSHLNWLANILEGKTFHHSRLVIGPSSYICASQFDEEQGTVFRARLIMARIIEHAVNNLKTLNEAFSGSLDSVPGYRIIFHSSVMRLVGEEKADPKDLLAFADEADATVGEDIRKNPIPITISHLFRGIDTDFQRQYAPQLVLP